MTEWDELAAADQLAVLGWAKRYPATRERRPVFSDAAADPKLAPAGMIEWLHGPGNHATSAPVWWQEYEMSGWWPWDWRNPS